MTCNKLNVQSHKTCLQWVHTSQAYCCCNYFFAPQVKILENVLLASSFCTRCSRDGGCTKLSAESSRNGLTATLCAQRDGCSAFHQKSSVRAEKQNLRTSAVP